MNITHLLNLLYDERFDRILGYFFLQTPIIVNTKENNP